MKARPTFARHWGLLAGAAALLAALPGWWLDRPLFWAAWLAAWWFCLGLSLGACASGWIHTLTAGRWGDTMAPAVRALRRPMPWVLLMFVPLLAGIGTIYPWARAPATWWSAIHEPGFVRLWFELPFVALRAIVYAVVWLLLARWQTRRAGQAALALLGYTVLTSLAGVDLLMSLVPGWSSSVFGWLVVVGQMTGGAAAAIELAAWSACRRGARAANERDAEAPVWRDLGNLLLMFVLLQAYLQFMQFLIIWAENLPREIAWYLPRLQTGWWRVGLALVLLQFAAPLLALLWRRIKDEPRRLMWVAAGITMMQAVDAAWLVVPSVEPTARAAWWLLPLIFGGMTLLLFGQVPARLRRHDPEDPVDA